MTDSPTLTYGFEYEFAGKRYTTHIKAASQDEAKEKLAAMSKAEYLGVLHMLAPNNKSNDQRMSL